MSDGNRRGGRVAELNYVESTDAIKQAGGLSLRLGTAPARFVFDVDEPFRFVFQLKRDAGQADPGPVRYTLKQDHAVVGQEQVELTDEQGTISAAGTRPGFVHVEIAWGDPAAGGIEHRCGVAVAPERIEPGTQMPDDFDDFWDHHKTRLAAVPLEASFTRIDHHSHPHLHDFSHKDLLARDLSKVEIDDVQVRGLDRSVSGIYSRPRRREPGKHPAMLCVQGAGVFPTRPHNFVTEAENGILVYEMNAHGISNLEVESWYKDLATGPLAGYSRMGRRCREESYWLGMFLRVKRGLDFLTAQPEWDGRTLVIRGSSQGGAQAMAGAYLEPRVTAFAAMVPASCDHAAFRHGRDFPRHLIERDESGRPVPETVETSRYFDGVNFMRRTRCAGHFTVGFVDGTCRPATVYAAYNVFAGPKTIVHQPYTAHANTPAALQAVEAFLAEHLQSTRVG